MSNVVKDDYPAGKLLKKYRENGQPRGKRSNCRSSEHCEPVLTNQRARFVEISIRKFSTVPREGNGHFGTLFGSGA
jgi:hypothetical protein